MFGAEVQGRGETGAPILELRDAAKSYGAVRALRDGDLALRSGEVRGLVGENGAGKSTVVKVLGGVVRPDAGELLMREAPVDFHSPHDARDAGIAVIYQEPTLFPDLSIAENVVMGYHPRGPLRRIDRRSVHEHAPVVEPRDAAEQLHERRLAGAVLAHERAHLAGAQRERAVLERVDRAVGLRGVLEREDRRG